MSVSTAELIKDNVYWGYMNGSIHDKESLSPDASLDKMINQLNDSLELCIWSRDSEKRVYLWNIAERIILRRDKSYDSVVTDKLHTRITSAGGVQWLVGVMLIVWYLTCVDEETNELINLEWFLGGIIILMVVFIIAQFIKHQAIIAKNHRLAYSSIFRSLISDGDILLFLRSLDCLEACESLLNQGGLTDKEKRYLNEHIDLIRSRGSGKKQYQVD